ncbi:MAG: kinase [Crenarchaeota archaeon]|nr:kinase [Thermoproteota archaeon]
MQVYIRTPARLHLGLIDLNGDLGRMFGGLGVGIDYPNTIVEATLSKNTIITGEQKELATTITKKFFEIYPIKTQVHINIKQAIQPHTGLGSGTQLSLAIATALAKICKIKTSTKELSLAMGRAQRTGIGTAIFDKGGFVVDGGKNIQTKDDTSFPPLIFRQPFPEKWRFMIVIPKTEKGLSGQKEKNAFTKLPPMSVEEIGKMCRLTMLKLLPALIEQDIENFGEALAKIQIITGKYFAQIQGGTYYSTAATNCIEVMEKYGVYGVGQSSWGPALYGVIRKGEEKTIQAKVFSELKQSIDAQVFVTKANNKGAQIRLIKEKEENRN